MCAFVISAAYFAGIEVTETVSGALSRVHNANTECLI